MSRKCRCVSEFRKDQDPVCTQQHVTMLLACIDIDDEYIHSIRSTILASMTIDNIVPKKVCPTVELTL